MPALPLAVLVSLDLLAQGAPTGPTTTSIPLSADGRTSGTPGLIVFIVVMLVIMGGFALLYLRNRGKGMR